jgi:AbrB family looped-hinge helix DNA binding protein
MKKSTHSEKIKEVVTDLGLVSAKEIIDSIENRYPEEKDKKSSYRSDIIGSSLNHSSQHHYPHMEKFLWFDEETKKYRLAEPSEMKASEKIKTHEYEEIDGIPVSRLGADGQIVIPLKTREQLELKPGDLLAFQVNEKKVLEIRKARVRLDLT